MQHILVYSDSATWGIIPGTRRRLPFDVRWPGVMELALTASGRRVRVSEDCLNGRRTVWDDPVKPGRNGFQGLAQGIGTLVNAIRQAPIEPGMPVPPVLVIAPPTIQTPRGVMAGKFSDAASKSAGLAGAYREVCEGLGCHFFDAGTVIGTSAVDGVHLDADHHARLGAAIAAVVAALPLGVEADA